MQGKRAQQRMQKRKHKNAQKIAQEMRGKRAQLKIQKGEHENAEKNSTRNAKKRAQECQRSSRGTLQHCCARRFDGVGAAPLMQCIMAQTRPLMYYDANPCKHASLRRGLHQKTSMLALRGNRMDCSFQSESDNKDTSPTKEGKMQAISAHKNRKFSFHI